MNMEAMFEGAGKLFNHATNKLEQTVKERLRKFTNDELIDKYVELTSDPDVHPNTINIVEEEMRRRRLRF
ncbi:MAG: hypothetical protein ATN35_09695 [Epulopiscium sp. Nele67-Bin004]|nr:MAG: hypothetical protein ATN35_09695 [Epulopiscium sp. Nele67-Bin004]